MSVSPSDHKNEMDWGSNLPSIPSSTGVFWPSVCIGILCVLFGVYLVLTPLPTHTDVEVDGVPTPVPVSGTDTYTRTTDGNVTTLSLAFVDSKDSTFALGLDEFARSVSERSHGELVIKLYPGGLINGKKLGERELVESVKGGNLDMCLSTTSPLSNYNHVLDIFDLPFIIANDTQADEVLEGDVGSELLSSLQEFNLQGLAYMEVGFRIFSSSIPIPDYQSFKDKKLRVMESVTMSRFVKSVGGDPVPAPVNKIYAMGKEGYIDGADRTYPTYWDFRLYDVHRFITETRHAYSVKMVLIDRNLYLSLPPEHQAAIVDSAREAAASQRRKQREADAEVKQLAIKEGIKIFELSEDERKKFIDSSKELYEEYRNNRSKSILDRVEAAGKVAP